MSGYGRSNNRQDYRRDDCILSIYKEADSRYKQQRGAAPPTRKVESSRIESDRQDYLKQTVELTLYIGNLPKSWNKQDIRNYFNNYGTITDVITMTKNREFSGAAMVRFSSLTDAEEAIERLRNTTIPGVKNDMNQATAPVNMKWSDIDEHRLGILQNDDHKLFIKSLPRQANSATLHEVFTLLGEVEEVHLEEAKYWAFVKYRKKQSALLAIKLLNGQTFLHGSRIPIEVRFKEKKYNSEPDSKQMADPMNIIPQVAIFQEIFNQEKHYYFNYATNQSQYEPPPPGSMVYRMDGTYYYQVDTSTENLNDMTAFQKTPGPPGANLFVFHLPNNMSKSNHNTEDSELHGLFKKFGNILSARVMTKDGKSKGFGFVSFDNSKSATDAIEEMNGLEISGKRLKVELKKGNENSAAQPTNSLKQVNFNPL